MARQLGRTTPTQTQARQQAADIIAQGRQMLQNRQTARTCQRDRNREAAASSADLEQEEPMKRYSHPIPLSANSCEQEPGWSDVQAALDRILENMANQNQILVDLLGAVNSLTAAVLSIQRHD